MTNDFASLNDLAAGRLDDEMTSVMPRSGVIDAAGEVMRAARHQR
jgi:hypothetical protein